MPILKFAADDLKPIIEHTILHFSNQCDIAYTKEQPKNPAVILVHDQGVYLMSNAKERLLKDPNNATGTSLVAYADKCHPEKDDEWYDNARDLVGGDDFAETLDWAISIKAQIDAGARQIKVRINKSSLALIA